MMFVLTVRSEVDYYVGIDYSLLSDPVFTSRGMDMHFRVSSPPLFRSILYCCISVYSHLFCLVLFCSILSCSILVYSVLFYSALLHPVLFRSILIYSVMFYSALFYSILSGSILIYSVMFYSALLCSNLLYRVRFLCAWFR